VQFLLILTFLHALVVTKQFLAAQFFSLEMYAFFQSCTFCVELHVYALLAFFPQQIRQAVAMMV